MFHLYKSKQFIRQLFQMNGFPIGNIQILLPHLFIQVRFISYPIQITDHRRQGCPKVVRHTGYQIVLGPFRFPFPFHQIFDMSLHLVHIPGDLTEFIQILYRDFLIQIPVCNIPHRTLQHPHITHVFVDQRVKSKKKGQCSADRKDQQAIIRIQPVRSQHGTAISHVAQRSRHLIDQKCHDNFHDTGNRQTDDRIPGNPPLKCSNKSTAQFYILPPRL